MVLALELGRPLTEWLEGRALRRRGIRPSADRLTGRLGGRRRVVHQPQGARPGGAADHEMPCTLGTGSSCRSCNAPPARSLARSHRPQWRFAMSARVPTVAVQTCKMPSPIGSTCVYVVLDVLTWPSSCGRIPFRLVLNDARNVMIAPNVLRFRHLPFVPCTLGPCAHTNGTNRKNGISRPCPTGQRTRRRVGNKNRCPILAAKTTRRAKLHS